MLHVEIVFNIIIEIIIIIIYVRFYSFYYNAGTYDLHSLRLLFCSYESRLIDGTI